MVICLPSTALTGITHERVGRAVDVHGAGAALRDAAAVFRAGEADLLPQHPQQRGVGLHVHLDGFAVDDEARHFLDLL